ncbi:peptidase [Lysobacter sp. CA199]|uniref:peptidase n=1 Tax=Lysobacter sp. CA199 TaxID=3455608 RepID=UPI003F8D3AFE
MTYCVGLKLDAGLVFMSDTRTNAGLDNVSAHRKMHVWEQEGERLIVLVSAGNLATTQAVIGLLDERARESSETGASVFDTPSMFRTAQLVGNVVKEVIADSAPSGQTADSSFNASFILGGQIRGSQPRLFLIYPEGNFIESTPDSPYFQIGETKYGRPIIVRAFDRSMSFAEAAKLLMVSFDSTTRSNLSVGLPLDLLFYENDRQRVAMMRRIEPDDTYYRSISEGWSSALKSAFERLPSFEWEPAAGRNRQEPR